MKTILNNEIYIISYYWTFHVTDIFLHYGGLLGYDTV
jgi:hypothetical protein